jgi:hypothetical protein
MGKRHKSLNVRAGGAYKYHSKLKVSNAGLFKLVMALCKTKFEFLPITSSDTIMQRQQFKNVVVFSAMWLKIALL